eukprot:TRINITY_DN14143_c0_g1_i1.p1 TRINITY_DN14143_c0_g1~~TRINITY_DN14143_c0_g1_i1.p1  ORF type:complete len:269 (+),score=85.05 TRINITY_DN14143_c0_g1_i1:70-876(+)
MSTAASVVVKTTAAPLLRLPVPIVLSKLIKFWDTWNGRDKTCRAIQYFAKFLAHYYQEKQKATGADFKIIAGQYKALSGNLSLARKAFRLFRWINFYEKLAKLFAESPNTKSLKAVLLYLFDFLQSFCFGIYLAYDGYVFAGKIGFILDKQVDLKARTANYWWFWALFAAIHGDLIRLYDGYNKTSQLVLKYKSIKDEDEKEKEQAMKELKEHKSAAMHKLRITFLKDAFDLLIPLSLNDYASWVPNSGQCGLLGTVSSLLGAYQAWP